jgi:hypothetical protein
VTTYCMVTIDGLDIFLTYDSFCHYLSSRNWCEVQRNSSIQVARELILEQLKP